MYVHRKTFVDDIPQYRCSHIGNNIHTGLLFRFFFSQKKKKALHNNITRFFFS